MYLAEVNSIFLSKLVEYNHFETGVGKTVLDMHFVHVSHKLGRWVRVGNDLESGEQLQDLLEINGMLTVVNFVNCYQKKYIILLSLLFPW